MTIRIGNKPIPVSVFINRYVRAIAAANIVTLLMHTFAFKKERRIILFGHALDGNLAAFARYLSTQKDRPPVYLMIDNPAAYHDLKARISDLPVDDILSSQRITDLLTVAKSSVLVTSHGLISLVKWQRLPKNKRPFLADVGHGLTFKGRMADGYQKMLGFDLHFVSSELSKKFLKKAGVPAKRIKVTGYARTDEFVDLNLTASERKQLLKQYDISPSEKRKIVLYAPTWDDTNIKDVLPFHSTKAAFFKQMEQFARDNNILILFRPHLNTNWQDIPPRTNSFRVITPQEYPFGEPVLKLVDVLVTDWSSIFAEYMALGRPTIFVDKEPSFGSYVAPLSLDDRPGAVTRNMKEFMSLLETAIAAPDKYLSKYKKKIKTISGHVWSDTLDGKTAQRYYELLKPHIK